MLPRNRLPLLYILVWHAQEEITTNAPHAIPALFSIPTPEPSASILAPTVSGEIPQRILADLATAVDRGLTTPVRPDLFSRRRKQQLWFMWSRNIPLFVTPSWQQPTLRHFEWNGCPKGCRHQCQQENCCYSNFCSWLIQQQQPTNFALLFPLTINCKVNSALALTPKI